MTVPFPAQARRLPILLAGFLALAGCVTEPGTTSLSTSAPAMGKVDDSLYVAKMDGNVPLPAVPVEKVPDQFQRQSVRYETAQPAGTIIIDPSNKFLFLVTGNNRAIRYGISVGRAGFEWSGEAVVTEKKAYPTWIPPKEMIARKPELAKWEDGQPGGPNNPLGARALYLTTNGRDYGYRIHGTPEWFSIGRNASSGCIRMIHQDVIDLFNRVPIGTKVIVLTSDGKLPTKLTIPPPQKVASPKPAAVPAKVEPVMPALPAAPALDPDLIAASPAVTPAVTSAPAATAPAVTPAPAATTPTCKVPLVNGICPPAPAP